MITVQGDQSLAVNLIMKIRLLKTSFCFVIITGIFKCNICFCQNEIGKRIDSLFTTYLDSGFSGAALVAEKGTVTLKKGYGYSDKYIR